VKRLLFSSLLLTAIALEPLPLMAQSVYPDFIPQNAMSVPRMGHQCVLLPDNSVLLIGGHGTGFVSLNSADLYVPGSHSFSLKNMNYYHDGGAIEKLQDGRLLLAGGAADLGVAPGYATAELFSATDTSFSPTGNMQYGHMLNSATLLRNGKVLVVGGWYNNASATNAELYDPASGAFSPAGTVSTLRANSIVVPTADSGAIIFSGTPIYGGAAYESVEYYNPALQSFTTVRSRLCTAPTDSAWIPMVYESYARLNDAQRLKNGNYVFMASKAYGDSSVYSLFTINPVTKEIALFRTKTQLPSSKEYAFFGPLVDTTHSLVYIPAMPINANPTQITLFAVSMEDSTVAPPGWIFTLPAGYYLSGTRFVLLRDGRILMSGGTSSNDYYTNFTPVQNAYLITPNYQPATDVEESGNTSPGAYVLNQNFPNPFNPSTVVSFQLPVASRVRLVVYDILGRELVTLFDGMMESGRHDVTFDGARLSSGVYVYRLVAADPSTGYGQNFAQTKKMILMK
jgi:hypothetical protein